MHVSSEELDRNYVPTEWCTGYFIYLWGFQKSIMRKDLNLIIYTRIF